MPAAMGGHQHPTLPPPPHAVHPTAAPCLQVTGAVGDAAAAGVAASATLTAGLDRLLGAPEAMRNAFEASVQVGARAQLGAPPPPHLMPLVP